MGDRPDWKTQWRRASVLALGILLALSLSVLRPMPVLAVAPEWSAAGSLLIPGLGQGLNGDWGYAPVHLGVYLGLANNYYKAIDDPDYIEWEDREDETDNTIRINKASADADMWGAALGNWALYSSFGAYRDGRALPENGGYSTPVPEESLTDLALSPFNPEFLFRPTVLIPLLFPLFYVFTPADSQTWLYKPDSTITRGELRQQAFLMHDMVAVGEEGFFRGVLNNSMSSAWGPWWGLAASSTVFGLAHSGTAGTANPLSAAAFGAYLGWRQQRNEYAIGEGVALHYWWNVLVTLAALRERPTPAFRIATFALRF